MKTTTIYRIIIKKIILTLETIFAAIAMKVKSPKGQQPVCNCFNNGKHIQPVHSKLQCCEGDKSISFCICQCKICGGLTGHPIDHFNKFMDSANSVEIAELTNKFYSNMQSPL
ncbi:MAG: hypothetical protein BA863_09965 [Desulfovibrio sp. S3730MH75]|nr:MAG: hypothetical protein BA863_09965 [Desulfovibrio sp. S3730MH75]